MPAAVAPTPTPAVAPVATPAPSTPTPPAAPAQSVLGLEPASPAPVDTPKASEAGTPEVTEATPPAAPTPIEVKWAEGVAVDEVSAKEFLGLAAEVGLDSAKTQKVVDFYSKVQAAQNEKLAEQRKEWLSQVENHKEFGGKNFEASKVVIAKAVAKFVTPELRDFLNTTGMGNHPALVQAFYRIGKSMAEDSVAGSSSAAVSTPATSADAFHRSMYPTMFKE